MNHEEKPNWLPIAVIGMLITDSNQLNSSLKEWEIRALAAEKTAKEAYELGRKEALDGQAIETAVYNDIVEAMKVFDEAYPRRFIMQDPATGALLGEQEGIHKILAQCFDIVSQAARAEGYEAGRLADLP